VTVVDAHLHLWRREPGRYGWLDTRGVQAIARTWDVASARDELAPTPVERVVLVQAENSLADTADMLAAADAWEAVAGVVAWAPLEDGLAGLPDDPRIVGVRHLNHDEPDPAWLARAPVLRGLERVAERGLTFDVVGVTERHLRDAAAIAGKLPELTVIVDHLGSPPIAEQGWQPWADAIADAAAQPNTFLKVSGLSTLAGEHYTPSGIARYLEHARHLFGVERLMYGGDWPVCRLATESYAQMWRVVDDATAAWERRDELFAARAYGLPNSSRSTSRN
jgi:L-fuconolactonase